MENNKVIEALDNAKAFLNNIVEQDDAIVGFLARPDVKLTLAILEGKFPAVKVAQERIGELSGYVRNIAKNAVSVIVDVEDIIKIVSNPLA